MLIILWAQFFVTFANPGHVHRRMIPRILSWVMRYSAKHKAEVHQRIVRDASRRVRRKGLGGAAVAAVMHDTGLTHGGFYKHFASKDELLIESVRAGFRDFAGKLVRAAEQARSEAPWKAIVKLYLSPEHRAHAERGCPVSSLAAELARVDETMKGLVLAELVNYRDQMVPFMPGRRTADKERAFFVIFSTMVGAIEIARLLPERAAREKVLENAGKFLLRSF